MGEHLSSLTCQCQGQLLVLLAMLLPGAPMLELRSDQTSWQMPHHILSSNNMYVNSLMQHGRNGRQHEMADYAELMMY